MNFVFISPNFPIRNYKWVESLSRRGVNVLGIGDAPFSSCHHRLQSSLKEYYFVKDLSNFDDMVQAISYFENKYGKIDYIESNNEWWLFLDSRLREYFNVSSGFYPKDMLKIKAKSEMKQCFKNGGAKVARYVLVNGIKDLNKAIEFAKVVNYPLFVKPNIGVGATSSYKINNETELKSFLQSELSETYILEEFLNGFIVSFDGVCDSSSNVVFATSDHFLTPIDEIVNNDEDYYYFNNPFSLPFFDLDKDKFLEVGKNVVKCFGIKKRVFHIEFFVLLEDKPGLAKKGEFVALECNMRPAGGCTPDLIDFANSLSIYDIYADIICFDENKEDLNKEKYYAFASSRRKELDYLHKEEEILNRFKNELCMHGTYPKEIARAMGDYYYYAKFKDYSKGLEFDKFVREKINK
ncbi:MAG TPA: carbamoylphosphate synthase large subunit [Firmicutes bacterium]|nr:carbamoylphosphate synthase large subunit [Bacillota bacterium]